MHNVLCHSITHVPVKESIATKALVTKDQYEQMYHESIANPETFWSKQAKRIDWIKPFTKIKNTQFSKPVSIKWFEDGELNVAANCVDRHAKTKGDQTAIIWEGDNPSESRIITYSQLLTEVCRFANVLKKLGAKKGDRIIIYMPMIPEAAFAMLACARIGAIHSVVFGGFSAESLHGRIDDCQASIVITADEGLRGGKAIPLKKNVDDAVNKSPQIKNVVVVKRTGSPILWDDARDHWYHELSATVDDHCPLEPMNAEDPLFILYTSGSTGKPKGVLHTSGGYLVYASLTHQLIFDYQPGEVYWCTADIGWITGHSYIIYGPLANGATTLMFEGIPNYPDFSRFWQVIDKHQVNIFYTAPTAIRALMREGVVPLQTTNRKSLRVLGSVGEPINPEAWLWYYTEVGQSRCPVIDTWWQTETGGILIAPLPGAIDLKPGSATLPFFGIEPAILDNQGQLLHGECEGNLCITHSWPGQMRTVYGDHNRFEQTYFSQFPQYYVTGDGARRDAHGYYWITGRVDDVLNVSGHRIGTAEVESALVAHPKVAEAAVVGYPHDIKGQALYCFVTLVQDSLPSSNLVDELKQWVRKEIGPIAVPDIIQWAPALPKTRSGKIMRRILRKIATNDHDDLGDTNTLTNPECVQQLIEGRAS